MSCIEKTISIIIGSLFMSVGINVFLIHNHLLDGGTFGVGLILHYLLGVKVGFVAIIISIPVFILAWFYKRLFFFNSLHGMLFSSLILDFSYQFLYPLGDLYNQNAIISAIIGGLLVGTGIGIMLRYDTSIGGTDLLGQIIANYTQINPGIIILFIDLCIVVTGSMLISDSSIFLSFLTVVCVGTMTSIISVNSKSREKSIISFET
ncbi:MAG: YitT family protein [Paenisporosarcina sp.]